MNKIMFDILTKIYDGTEWDVKKYAQQLYKPYSVIEHEYKNLIYEGEVDDSGITEKGKKILEEHRINNAIILAAGVSSRFVPICFEKPKALLCVKGEVLIERQIRQLRQAGIKDIIVVVGYMKEKFYYLKDKYNVRIVETDTYRVRNNHASVYAARDYLMNTIVTSADLYFTKNIFQRYAYDAFYCTVYKEGTTDERGVITDKYDKILKTKYGVSDSWVTLGYAFFNNRFSTNFLSIMDEEYNLPETVHKFWADIQDEHLKELYMYVKKCDSNVIYEFDSLDELRQFDNRYINDSGSVLIKKIAELLKSTEGELRMFAPIAKGEPGRGFTFYCDEKKYICSIDKDSLEIECKRYDDKIQELVNLTESFDSYYGSSLPLCAAENVISPFANLPLSMGFQERYIVGNSYSYREDDNFIGSTYLLPFYNMIGDECKRIFGAKYTDARTLTGMNCLMMVVTSLAKIGDKVLILDSAAGGHSSVRPICERLGLNVGTVPYDFNAQDIDYNSLNNELDKGKANFVLLAPSDIIKPFDVSKINLTNTTLLYDVSQLLGLIGAGLIKNPLNNIDNMVMFGGTHKTFPGPACGLIMTNNERLHNKLETTINPIYIRHTQMHQKVSLLFALVEFETFGKSYEEHIIELSNALGAELEKRGLDIGKININNKYSETQQVFMYTSKDIMEVIYRNSERFGITLNKKNKELFKGHGIRLGTQEIARYGWPTESMCLVADIIKEISRTHVDDSLIDRMIAGLPEKRIQYTYDDRTLAYFKRFIQKI